MTSEHSYVLAGQSIGYRLVRDAVWAGDACTWFGWNWRKESQNTIPAWESAGPDLGDGTAGIGLFLAELSLLTKDRLILKTARGALKMAATTAPFKATDTGFFKGRGGTAVVLARAGHILNDAQLTNYSRQIFSDICSASPVGYSVYQGSAGTIQALLIGHSHFGDPKFLKKAIELGDALIKMAHKKDGLISWPSSAENDAAHPNLVGLAHGTDGIACVLAKLADVSGKKYFLDAALAALAYTAASFDWARQLWPDYRFAGSQPNLGIAHAYRYPATWEFGAAGIAHARLALAAYLPENDSTKVACEFALNAITSALGTSPLLWQDFSLTTGLAGFGETLLDLDKFLGRPDLFQTSKDIADLGVNYHLSLGHSWMSGGPGNQETPGLLRGSAGIGRFFLRMNDAKASPSILLPMAESFLPVAAKKPAMKKAVHKRKSKTKTKSEASNIIEKRSKRVQRKSNEPAKPRKTTAKKTIASSKKKKDSPK